MAQSSIITGQYVELTQTPASVGDRLIAAIIDYVVLGVYSMFVGLVFSDVLSRLLLNANTIVAVISYILLYSPVIFYYPFCEIFAKGQSLGKLVMKTRVVTVDGNAPTVGSSLLRWLLYPVDTVFTGGLGVVFITFGKHRQRLGDLAAGTMVIKTSAAQYDFFTINDYSYVQQGRSPSSGRTRVQACRAGAAVPGSAHSPEPLCRRVSQDGAQRFLLLLLDHHGVR